MNCLRLVLVVPLVAAGCVEAKKSENPLSPTIAGPIAGVNISRPDTVEPKDNVAIPVASQPITLVVQNAQTNGVRPLRYRFELAADVSFTNVLFIRDDVPPGEGRTQVRLPDALQPERTYYWRARAEDGANTGEFSGYAFFRVYTPIVIQRPVLQNPVNNVETGSTLPEFVIGNAPRSGPVGAVAYEVELSDTAAFANKLAIWVINEQPGITRFAPSRLAGGTQYFWRARAFDPSTSGPWSEVQAFRTPVEAAPSGTLPPSGCSGPAGSVLQTLHCMRSDYPTPFQSNAQRVHYLNRVAYAHNLGLHRDSGSTAAPQPRTGIWVSTDLLVEPNGAVYDVLVNEEEPTWRYIGPINTMGNFVPAVQP